VVVIPCGCGTNWCFACSGLDHRSVIHHCERSSRASLCCSVDLTECQLVLTVLDPSHATTLWSGSRKTVTHFDHAAPVTLLTSPDCAVLIELRIVAANDGENANWIMANTKMCPSCKVHIEKNQGCNHMTCKQCRHEFCWLCKAKWAYVSSPCIV